MLEGTLTGLALGLWLLLAFSKAAGRDVTRWEGANLALAALAIALGLALTFAVLPAAWWPQARSLALGTFMLWLGWRTAYASAKAKTDPGLRILGWIAMLAGVVELTRPIWS